MSDITAKSLTLANGDEGHLIFIDDKLAAVVSRLGGDENLPEHRGAYFIEAAFGPYPLDGAERLFGSLQQAARSVARASSPSDHCCGGCGG